MPAQSTSAVKPSAAPTAPAAINGTHPNGTALASCKTRDTRRTAENYTASEIKVNRPADYKLAVAMLSNGIPKNKIARTLGFAWWTVAAIERAEIQDIRERKRLLAEKCFAAATAAIDSAHERALAGKASAFDAKLLVETWLALQGEAGQFLEPRVTIPALERLEEMMGRFKVRRTIADHYGAAVQDAEVEVFSVRAADDVQVPALV
jgi:hypothetical protein